MRFFSIVMTLALLAACASPSITSKSTKVVDRSFAIASSSSNSGSDRFHIAVSAFDTGGKLTICAAIAVKGSSTFTQEWGPAIADALYVQIGDERVITGVPFAAVFVGEETAKGKPANCGVTDQPWKPGWSSNAVGFRVGRVQLSA